MPTARGPTLASLLPILRVFGAQALEDFDGDDAHPELKASYAAAVKFGKAAKCRAPESFAFLLYIALTTEDGLGEQLRDDIASEADPDAFVAELKDEFFPTEPGVDVRTLPLDLRPYDGVGPLRFGFTEAEVGAVLGPPQRVRNWVDSFEDDPVMAAKFADARSEYRIFGDVDAMLPTANYNGGKLTSLEFFPEAHGALTHRGVALFGGTRQEDIDQLLALDDDAWHDQAQVVFRGLGVAMATPEEAENSRGINVFVRGDLDEQLAEMKPLRRA